MSYCCVDLVEKQPFRCDACRDMEHRVTRILREQTFGPLGDIQPSQRLDQLDASIFFPVCVTCALDEEFDIELPDEAIKATDTVADVIATVGALVEAEIAARDPEDIRPF